MLVKRHNGKTNSFLLFVLWKHEAPSPESQLQWPGQHVTKKRQSLYAQSEGLELQQKKTNFLWNERNRMLTSTVWNSGYSQLFSCLADKNPDKPWRKAFYHFDSKYYFPCIRYHLVWITKTACSCRTNSHQAIGSKHAARLKGLAGEMNIQYIFCTADALGSLLLSSERKKENKAQIVPQTKLFPTTNQRLKKTEMKAETFNLTKKKWIRWTHKQRSCKHRTALTHTSSLPTAGKQQSC